MSIIAAQIIIFFSNIMLLSNIILLFWGVSGSSSNSDDQQPVCSEARALVMDDMYGQRRKLETVFYFFDSDGDGVSNFNNDDDVYRL